jgi:hypothetical protein
MRPHVFFIGRERHFPPAMGHLSEHRHEFPPHSREIIATVRSFILARLLFPADDRLFPGGSPVIPGVHRLLPALHHHFSVLARRFSRGHDHISRVIIASRRVRTLSLTVAYTRCTLWHTICDCSHRPAAGREMGWCFYSIAAERRPTTTPSKGEERVVWID